MFSLKPLRLVSTGGDRTHRYFQKTMEIKKVYRYKFRSIAIILVLSLYVSIENVWTQEAISEKFQCLFLNKMDSDEELDLMLLAMVLIKKIAKAKKKESMGKGLYKSRETFGIDRLVNEMKLTDGEAYLIVYH